MTSERLTPRISVNKLGEYIAANPARRRRIIYDQKFPQGFITARYSDAQEIISEYLAQGKRDPSFIAAAIERLMSITPRTDWEQQNNVLCAEALEHFIEVEDELLSKDVSYEILNPMSPSSIIIANVDISIRPELKMVFSQGRKAGRFGVLKLAFSKTNPITVDVAETISSLLHYYAECKCPKGEVVARELCVFVDVFGEKITVAPTSFKRRMKDVDAACQEIDALWTRIQKSRTSS